MSTSSSAAVARAKEPDKTERPFSYAEAECAAGPESPLAAEELKRRLQTEWFEQGRQQGVQQGRAEMQSAVQAEQEKIVRALQEFTAERQSYYRRVEQEVVQLALGIARKILHREAQLDPHTLAGIVRVTLEKLDAGTQITLHVHPKEAADWRHYFACQSEGNPPPEVREDPLLEAGGCRIETSMGITQVGFESQLKEIETGLLDLLAERPGAE